MQHAAQMLSVVLQDSWAQFVRGLIVSSASGKAISTNGLNIVGPHSKGNVANVEKWLIANRSGNRDLDWHVSSIALYYAKQLNIPNRIDVASALGSTNSPEAELRVYRNFIVHRCKDTAAKIYQHSSLSTYRYTHLQEIPMLHATGGGRVYEHWIQRFQLVASVASKT